jgi:hypothetical protein
MSKLLNIDEMLDCAREAKMPGAEEFIKQVEAMATNLGQQLASHLGVKSGDAHFEGVAFAGTCVGFYQKTEGQKCPEPLTNYDETEWGEEPE